MIFYILRLLNCTHKICMSNYLQEFFLLHTKNDDKLLNRLYSQQIVSRHLLNYGKVHISFSHVVWRVEQVLLFRILYPHFSFCIPHCAIPQLTKCRLYVLVSMMFPWRLATNEFSFIISPRVITIAILSIRTANDHVHDKTALYDEISSKQQEHRLHSRVLARHFLPVSNTNAQMHNKRSELLTVCNRTCIFLQKQLKLPRSTPSHPLALPLLDNLP